MDDETRAGLAWLAVLAERYEAAGRAIRSTIAAIETMPIDVPVVLHDESAPAVGLSEAIRFVLARARGPMMPTGIWSEIVARKIAVQTRSKNPGSMMTSTLAAMKSSGQVKRVDGGWTLTA